MAVTGIDSGGHRLALLARAGELLASPGAGDRMLERLAGLLAGSLATWCAIDVLADDGSIERVATAPDRGPRLRPDGPHGPAVVMRTGEPELVSPVTEELVAGAAAGAPTSYMCVPLMVRDRPFGAITLLSGDRVYGPAEADLVGELARRAAAAIENARLIERLARSEERYRLLFDANPLPMWVYDAKTLRFLAVNDAAVRHYGYTRAEFLAMSITEIRPPEDVEALLSELRDTGGPGSPLPGTWRHRRKDGSVIDVEITAGKVLFEDRPAALVLAHDVTERRRLEERLAQSEKLEAIGRLAGGVAHDFNNLLTVISGYAELLLARGTESREQLGEIAHAADQAAGLTRQLLAFSRRQVLHPQVLDVNEIVAGMEPMVRRIIGDDVGVGVRLAPGTAAVEADRAQLERVILNLAANARDAMPEGGRLTIETAVVELDEEFVRSRGEGTAGLNVLLAVSDTGVGMSEEVQRHLFEPFFTTKGPGAGTGLGLSTVFGVVKQSGGSIYVYSEEGRGTTFKVYLPAAAPDRLEPAATPADEAAERGTETIVLVEDDDGVRDLVRVMLESKGYRVLAAAGAGEAERMCAECGGDVDLLLTDVVMPEANGRVLAERLAATSPSIRVLFMSGYSDEAVYRHGEISPDAAFIEKPFTDRALARKVREVLD